MANIFEFLSKDGNITPEKARKLRQMQFHDKTAYVWGLRYRWDPSLSMRSFAIDEPRSSARALYVTLVKTNKNFQPVWECSQTPENHPGLIRELIEQPEIITSMDLKIKLSVTCLKYLRMPFTPLTSFNFLTASSTLVSSSWSLGYQFIKFYPNIEVLSENVVKTSILG